MIPALLAASLSSGLLLAATLRVHGLLAWIVAAPLAILANERLRWRHVVLSGAVFGATAATLAHADWLAETAQRYFTASGAFAWTAALGLTIGVGVGQGILLALGLRCALSRPGVLQGIVAGGALWAAWDWVTLHAFPYYPWAALAAAQTDLPLALSSAHFVGGPGLTFAIAATGLAWGSSLRSRSPLACAGVGVGLATAVLILGVSAKSADRRGEAPLCTVAVVDIEQKQPPAPLVEGRASGDVLERYLASTRSALAGRQEAPAAILWPESALPASPETDAEMRHALQQLASQSGSVLLAGGAGFGWDGAWKERRFNSVFRVDAAGQVERYDKRWLVPFAEYWPWAWVPAPRTLQTQYVEPGRAATILRGGECRFGVLVCFEAERAELAAELARAGADALLVFSNDAHLPAAEIALEAAQANLRAAETGLPVIRAANAGLSFAAGADAATSSTDSGLLVRLGAPRLAPALTIAPLVLWISGIVSALAIVSALRRFSA